MGVERTEIPTLINLKLYFSNISEEKMKILDLGCGKMKIKGFIEGDVVVGLDSRKLPGVDVVWNIEETPLPFSNNEFDYVNCSHILEHVQNFIPLMEELYRIIKNKGVIHIEVPNYRSEGAFTDPTHKRFFTLNTFNYFTEDLPLSTLNYYSTARFEIISKKKRVNGRKLNLVTSLIKNEGLNWLAKKIILTLVGKSNEYNLIFDLQKKER